MGQRAPGEPGPQSDDAVEARPFKAGWTCGHCEPMERTPSQG